MNSIFQDMFEARMMDDFEKFSNDERYKRYDLKERINRFVKRYREYEGRQLQIYKLFGGKK